VSPGKLWPRSVATTSGRLLVVSHPNVLLVHGVGGRRLCRVSLPRGLDVQHCVATDHGTFVVGLSRAVDTRYLVREVNLDGDTVRICAPDEFKLPVHLAVGPFPGDVIVADPSDGRVVVVDSRLRVKRVLLGGSEPRRLMMMPQHGLLYVCELHRVSLWKISQ